MVKAWNEHNTSAFIKVTDQTKAFTGTEEKSETEVLSAQSHLLFNCRVDAV